MQEKTNLIKLQNFKDQTVFINDFKQIQKF